MNRISENLQELSVKPWFVITCGICSIIGASWIFLAAAKEIGVTLPILFFAVAFAIYITSVYLSFRLFGDYKSLRIIPRYLHRINHIYRDALYQCFGDKSSKKSPQERSESMKITVKSICQKIANVYTSELKGRPCLVTVKLITQDEKGRSFCKTYVRGEEDSERDLVPHDEFEVGTGANTAFDTALRLGEGGKCSHFYSGDLIKLAAQRKYNNQRPNWERFYRSTIVVPIRWLNRAKIGQRDTCDNVGFLCVDTLSRNRLKDGYHVELLAAFADQMYNFICLMRGKYSL